MPAPPADTDTAGRGNWLLDGLWQKMQTTDYRGTASLALPALFQLYKSCISCTTELSNAPITSSARVAQWIRRDPPKVEIAGSSPAVSFRKKVIFSIYQLKQRSRLIEVLTFLHHRSKCG